MAIAFDATSGANGAGSPNTFAHTCTGSNLILFVAVRAEGGTGACTGVTYNSVALTKIGETNVDENNSLWYLINPATGANNIAVSYTGAYGQAAAASYTGAKQSGVPDASGTNTGTGTSLAKAVTTVLDNCWVVASGQDNNGAGVTSAGASTTARKQQNNSLVLLDTNEAVTPAGSRTINLSDTSGSAHLSLVVASFAPATDVISTYSGTPANSVRIGDASGSYYTAQQFTTTASGTIPSLKWYSRINDGSPTSGITVAIWTDSSDSPGSLISGATENVTHASIVDGANSWDVAEFTTVTFSSPPTVVNATKYWIVTNKQGSVDAVNYYNAWATAPSSYAGGLCKQGTSAPSWGSALDTDQVLIIAINESASGPANLKSYNTNLKANIKSINTNLIANVKSLDTNI